MEFDETLVPGPLKSEMTGGGGRKLKVSVEGEKTTVLDRSECAQKAQTPLCTEASRAHFLSRVLYDTFPNEKVIPD